MKCVRLVRYENESDKMGEIGRVGDGLDGQGWGLVRCVKCAQ